ncbi:DUF7305 domain-containing protein [Actomonas aquatica]|uniref:Collagen-binding domain-containing protein n=1 Tax=Actomonas aquatica TaxID=2866162 RepID=A0ABZ1C4X7_9BACT|nr:collagen-binding domain-containing protein [Opitutus sp. WL0086]WRQ86786.1 collagen-binding domain-containing protein [Opitutus sp. WL0086]
MTPFRVPSRRRGSLLVVAMLLLAAIGVSLASYLNIGQTNLRISNRAFYANAAINLAETGLEQAMWSINKAVDGAPNAWNGWSADANNAWRNFTGFDFDANSTGNVRVYVRNHTLGIAPVIVARATITPAQGDPIEKWIRVSLTKRSLFANGLVAKDTLTFSGGNASVDSYDSRLGVYNASLGAGANNRFPRGSAGSGSVAVNSFTLSNSDIFGYVSIGTADYSGLDVGPNGVVSGNFAAAAGTIDYSRVTTDFTTNFEDAAAPTTAGYSIGSINSAFTLPRALDLPAADGKFYYDVTSISLSGPSSRILSIAPGRDVVIRITSASGTGVSVGGNASIQVLGSATLELYAASNISIAGRGIANANDPAAFQFWSTRAAGAPGSQSVDISGNGQLSAVVYAPNADVSMNGGGVSGSVYGAVVSNTITINGGSEFHYDEALSDMTSGNPFGIANWTELTTSSARSLYSGILSF